MSEKLINDIMTPLLSIRGLEWSSFSERVFDHIETYTVLQYGDYPNDMASDFTEQDFITQIKKYAARLGNNARGAQEAQRDLLKIAHYCAMLYMKRESTHTSTGE